MLGDTEAIATVAVKDLKKAAKFYEGRLGLEAESTEGDEVITYRTGAGRLNVYRSDFAGSNQATAATWVVGNELEAIVRALRTNGVAFEHYVMPGMKLEGDVHVGNDMKVAWFKDPDGNIFNLVNR